MPEGKSFRAVVGQLEFLRVRLKSLVLVESKDFNRGVRKGKAAESAKKFKLTHIFPGIRFGNVGVNVKLTTQRGDSD